MFDVKKLICESFDIADEMLSKSEIYDLLEYPPDSKMGDVAMPCFRLSKKLRKSPEKIALEMKEYFKGCECIKQVENVSGYLNFFINEIWYIKNVFDEVLKCKANYGSSALGEGKTVVIDYSAPNIAKPFHIGHLRSTAIGNALYRIFEFMGYNVVGVNHLGDWGTQFGKLIVAYKKWGSDVDVEGGGVKALMSLYVKFHNESELNPELEDQAREWFLKMEKGDEEAIRLWQWIKDVSLLEFQKVYELMGAKFDSWAGESFYNDKTESVVDTLKQRNLLKESEGAFIVELDGFDMPHCMILKKDGGTLYATRDIAAAIYRKQTYNFDKCIYVTSAGQSLHFAQWFKVVELMGYDWADKLAHVPFGTVNLGGEKLSTRKGKVVLLEEIFEEAIKKTKEIIEAKNPNIENKEQTATSIGVGAVVFSDLFSNRIKDVTFSWDEVLDFDGETGPYVQYTYARACSVLSKSEIHDFENFDAALLCTREEFEVAKTLYEFPLRLAQSVNMLEPSVITRYLVEVARSFNRFYHLHPILAVEPNLRKSRLALVFAVKTVLEKGLWLIGLDAPLQV